MEQENHSNTIPAGLGKLYIAPAGDMNPEHLQPIELHSVAIDLGGGESYASESTWGNNGGKGYCITGTLKLENNKETQKHLQKLKHLQKQKLQQRQKMLQLLQKVKKSVQRKKQVFLLYLTHSTVNSSQNVQIQTDLDVMDMVCSLHQSRKHIQSFVHVQLGNVQCVQLVKEHHLQQQILLWKAHQKLLQWKQQNHRNSSAQ
jgi:hypothetical protein